MSGPKRTIPNSLLAWYKTLIRLKKTVPAFENGANIMLDPENTKVLSWMRQAPGAHQVVVCVNFMADAEIVDLTLDGPGMRGEKIKDLAKDARRTGNRGDRSHRARALWRVYRRGAVTGLITSPDPHYRQS